jgi:tRNA (cytidine32/guanosine34-2'-O)-methyltransferase
MLAQLKIVFERVRVAKPRSSRASSIEAFVVCEGFCPPEGFTASLDTPLGAGTKLPDTKPHSSTDPARRIREDGVVEIELGSESEADGEGQGAEHAGSRWIAPFLACGDLSAYDSDATYHLPKDRVALDPVQPPTAPPYKRALEMRKLAGGAYGKTKLQESSDLS